MPLPSINIEDLPDGGTLQPTDRLALQRNEAGVWVDYRTEGATVNGAVLTATYTWQTDVGLSDTIPVSGGQYVILISAHATLPADPGFTGLSVQITFSQGGIPAWGYIEPVNTVNGSGARIGWQNDPTTTPYADLDQPIDLSCSPGGFALACRLVVQYVLVDPV